MFYLGFFRDRLAIGLLLLGGCSSNLFAEDWTRFRGPNGSGVSAADTIPTEWTDDDYHWKIDLPGEGHSSPVVFGDRVFVTAADLPAKEAYLLCYQAASGKEVWRRTFSLSKYRKHTQNSYASPTPTVDDQHVYMLWQSPKDSQLVAFTHQGEQAWSYSLGAFKAGHGSAVSPIVHNGVVYFCNDQTGPSYLLALDAATGKERWKLPRDTQRACYSTPCIYTPEGRSAELIVSHSFAGVTSHDLNTGKLNWKIVPFGDFKQRACASPIIAGEHVIGTSGFATAEKNVVVLQPPRSANEEPTEVYRITKTAPHVPTPLVYGDRMYLWNDRGVASCANLATGEIVWTKRVGGNYFGSPVWVNGKLYCIDTDGVVTVIAAADEFEILARNDLGEGSCSTPAVANGRMYLRTKSHLFSLGDK